MGTVLVDGYYHYLLNMEIVIATIIYTRKKSSVRASAVPKQNKRISEIKQFLSYFILFQPNVGVNAPIPNEITFKKQWEDNKI